MEEGVVRDDEMEGLEEGKKKIGNYMFAEGNYFSTYSPPMRINDLYPVNLEDVEGALSSSDALSLNPFQTDATNILNDMDSFDAGEIEGRLSIDETVTSAMADSLMDAIDSAFREEALDSGKDAHEVAELLREMEPNSCGETNFSRSSSEKTEEGPVDFKTDVNRENFLKTELKPEVSRTDTIKDFPEGEILKTEKEEDRVIEGPSFILNQGLQPSSDTPSAGLDSEAKTDSTSEESDRSTSNEEEANAPSASDRIEAGDVNSVALTTEGGAPMEAEEGELEEGELEDEETQEQALLTKEKNLEFDKEQKEEIKEIVKPEKIKPEPKEAEKNNKIMESGERKEKSERKKRKHKEKEEESEKSKLKKRKHHFTPEDEPEGGARKKVLVRDKPLDFDTLLKRQMYLMGSGSNPENLFLHEDNNFEHNQFRGECDSFESGSGDEWGDGPKSLRRRISRKRRGGSRSPSRKNEAICMFYLQGSCKRGGDCPYSHDIAPTRKMELCKFYMMDCCAKREKCLYMHKDFPCKYYHFGIKCKDGDLCKFSHDLLQDIVKNILIKHIELAPKDILGDFPRLTKRSAQIILTITEAKRNGDPIDNDLLEKVSENEGKGFRYLDRALKNVRKKKDGERNNKSGGGGGEKEEEPSKAREKDKEREKSPKKPKSYDKEDHREREKEKKERDNHRRDREKSGGDDKGGRSRDKGRHDRHRSDGGRSSLKCDPAFETPFKMKDPFAGMTPKQKELSLRLEDRRQQQQQDYSMRSSTDRNSSLGANYPIRGDSYPGGDSYPEGDSYPMGTDPYPMQDTRWYSSDEEVDPNRSPEGRRDSFASPPGGRRQRTGDSWGLGNQNQNMPQGHNSHSQAEGQGHPQANFLEKSNLSNIDFSYLKNVLNTVQSQTSQNKNLHTSQDSRSNNWGGDQRRSSTGFPSRDRSANNYMDIANDIKEVFYDPPEPTEPRNFSRNLDSFIHSAREMSSGPGNFSKLENRASPILRSNRDSQDSSNESSLWKQRDVTDPRLKGGIFAVEDSLNSDSNTSFATNPKNPDNYLEGDKDFKGDISPNREKAQTVKKDSGIKVGSSIYDLGYGSQDSIQSPEYDEGSSHLPFKVPLHSSAKEIDGSINTHTPIPYRLVPVTVPKPDFSKLKINKNDPKTLEDPRLKRMLRRPSTEECSRSPCGAPVVTDVEQPFGSPLLDPKDKLSTKIAEIESRDPRKVSNRDPRADPRTDPRGDPRTDPARSDNLWPDGRGDSCSDPRLDNRNTPTDPRTILLDPRVDSWVDPRMDPRMAQRPDSRGPGCRMDPRDNLLGSDMRDTDPRVGGPVFTNGLIDGPGYNAFAGIGNLSAPMMPPGIDPRGRPGLLGPGPSPNSLALGQISQSLNPSAFLLQSAIGHQGGPFMQRERSDMMGGPGPNFSQGQGWGGGGRSHFNDPRLGSNGDFQSSMS